MNYILGGGLVGLVTAYYNPSYTVIDELKSRPNGFPCGPEYLWHTPDVVDLLDDLKLDYNVKKIIIKYGNGSDDDTLNKSIYYSKSRCSPVVIPPSHKAVCEGKGEIDIVDVNFTTLRLELLKHVNVIEGRAHHIMYTNFMIDHSRYEYDKLISTIPAPIFFKDYVQGQYDRKFLYTSKIFQRVFTTINNADVIYICDPSLNISRITKVNDETVVYEYNVTEDQYERVMELTKNNMNIQGRRIAQVISSEPVKDIDNVKFVGRYARWEHGIKMHDVIKEVKKWSK